MRWGKQHWRGTAQVFAVILICAGAFCGYWWLYKLAPSRRTLNPEWCASHSQREYWSEVQKGIRRGVWLHDDGFAVGRYGDKSWAEWIMAHVPRGESMGCFGRLCHSASAMCYITNQDVGEDADAWLDWWVNNSSKSQDQWIADGFRQRGVEVDVPPSADQMPALLRLLGNSDTNESAGIPEYVKHNAFRCLRDSDFDPVRFAISSRRLSPDVEAGLLEYALLQRRSVTASRVGALSFENANGKSNSDAIPAMLTPKFQFVAYALVVTPLLLGTGLLAWSFRKRDGRRRSTVEKLSN